MKFKKLSKNKKRKISQFNKKMGCLFFALLMMLSLATPAFAAVNVDGSGGTSSDVTGGGAYTYAESDQMWKISIYYSRYDYVNTDSKYKLWNDSYWKQYGKTFYMYHPTAIRGAGGKIRLNVFKSAIFMNGNKVEFLGQTNDVSKVKVGISFYNNNHFYANTKSPAIAFNGYTIDPVKDFFETDSNFIDLAKQAYLAAGYDNWTDCFVYPDGPNKGKKVTFSIDGFSGSYVDKTANSGKSATSGYTWDTTQKHLTFNDWYKGIKTDYKGKQIYLHPKTNSSGTFLAGTAWMVVYEPVVMAEVNPFTLGGKTYRQVACTPTEWAILAENGIIELKNYRKHMLCYVGNSTYLEEDWNGLKARGSEFPTDVSNGTVYQKGGIGMACFDPYNYVIKD